VIRQLQDLQLLDIHRGPYAFKPLTSRKLFMADNPPTILEQPASRKEVLKKAAHVTPALFTLAAVPAFAAKGSGAKADVRENGSDVVEVPAARGQRLRRERRQGQERQTLDEVQWIVYLPSCLRRDGSPSNIAASLGCARKALE